MRSQAMYNRCSALDDDRHCDHSIVHTYFTHVLETRCFSHPFSIVSYKAFFPHLCCSDGVRLSLGVIVMVICTIIGLIEAFGFGFVLHGVLYS